MKPRHLCPHCFRALDMSKSTDRGDYWLVECDFCHNVAMVAKASVRRDRN